MFEVPSTYGEQVKYSSGGIDVEVLEKLLGSDVIISKKIKKVQCKFT